MSQRIFMEMIHLTFEAPSQLDKPAYLRLRRALHSRQFRNRLREAIKAVVGRYPSLQKVHLTISQLGLSRLPFAAISEDGSLELGLNNRPTVTGLRRQFSQGWFDLCAWIPKIGSASRFSLSCPTSIRKHSFFPSS